MKVFTVHNNTDKIFSTKEKAVNHIIKVWFIAEPHFYKDFRHEALIECAGKLVVEHIVE
jgi:hypothetical protein